MSTVIEWSCIDKFRVVVLLYIQPLCGHVQGACVDKFTVVFFYLQSLCGHVQCACADKFKCVVVL